MPRTKTANVSATSETPAVPAYVKAYKGFDRNLTCRGFQFEIGKGYSVDGVIEACANGFHACEYPAAVLEYYPAINGTRYCEVELSGDMDVDGDKTAARNIRIVRELTVSEFIKAAVAYTVSKATPEEGASATGTKGAASATGDQGAASATGTKGAAAAFGMDGRVMGSEGNALFLVERLADYSADHGKIIAVWAGIVGHNGIKPNIFYRLVNGVPVEVEV